MDMGGYLTRRRHAGGGGRVARQATGGPRRARALACGTWLVSFVIVAGVATPAGWAQTVTPAATDSKPPTPAPAAAVQIPDAPTSGLAAKESSKDLPVPQFVLPADLAKKIGHKIWLNETGGRREALLSWNANEDFASLGIGHFIWFPVGKWLPYEESFPALLEFMRAKNVRLPAWLDQPQIPANPWTSRAEFRRHANSPQMNELRQFMLATVAEQTQFMVARAQGAMEKILKTTQDGAERDHLVRQFTRIIRASGDFYPLIDYINFKGEGTNPNEAAVNHETGRRQGWGLKQVLLRMNGASGDAKTVRAEFADAAQAVLQQRVRNIPSNRVFEAGWLRRVATYRRAVGEVETGPGRAPRRAVRVTAVR